MLCYCFLSTYMNITVGGQTLIQEENENEIKIILNHDTCNMFTRVPYIINNVKDIIIQKHLS